MVYKDIVITIPKNKKYIILRLFYQENKLFHFQCYKVVGRDCYHIGHNRTHTGEKPYYCSQFAEAFSQNIHLITYMMTHWEETIQMQSL